jgi:uncharacterized coiled-coil protein SlyX
VLIPKLIRSAANEGLILTTWQYDSDDIDDQPPEEEVPQAKRRVPLIIVAAGLAALGVASAFGWRAYNGVNLPALSLGTPAVTRPTSVGLDEFKAFQQQIVGQMQSATQALAAQQAESKRLSDQMGAISAKIDALQSSISSARAAVPTAQPPALPPKKPANPKPSPRISTGGTPLPPPTQLTR